MPDTQMPYQLSLICYMNSIINQDNCQQLRMGQMVHTAQQSAACTGTVAAHK